MSAVMEVIAGMVTMGYFVAGLFFLRFWRDTRDQLFLSFSVAFWLFALNQALVTVSGLARDDASWFYLLRLAGFALIILAIVRKNRQPSRQSP